MGKLKTKWHIYESRCLNLLYYTLMCVVLTWASPACSVPPGPVKSSSLSVQIWSRKSSIIFWFSSAPMKRFHLSVFTRSTQKACSRRKSTLSSDNTIPTLREGSWGTRTPAAPPLPKPPLLLLVPGASAMKSPLTSRKKKHCRYFQCVGHVKPEERIT